MTSRHRGPSSVLGRRVSIYDTTSPARRRSPFSLPKVQKEKSPQQRRGPSPPLAWVQRRTGSVDTTCTSATSAAQSLLASKETPMWGKTQLVPFPGAYNALLEERNVIATPSSTGDRGLNDISLDESLCSYIGAEVAPRAALTRRRFQCPTPVPILSSTPDLTDKEVALVAPLVKLHAGKSPKALSRTRAPARGLKPGLRLPAMTSPLRPGAISPIPTRNITPSPFRAHTDMRVKAIKKPERRSPMHVR